MIYWYAVPKTFGKAFALHSMPKHQFGQNHICTSLCNVLVLEHVIKQAFIFVYDAIGNQDHYVFVYSMALNFDAYFFFFFFFFCFFCFFFFFFFFSSMYNFRNTDLKLTDYNSHGHSTLRIWFVRYVCQLEMVSLVTYHIAEILNLLIP